MSGVPYIRLFGDDWLSGTNELSLEERGALITIVTLTASTGQPPEYDLERISRRFGCTKNRAKNVINSLVKLGKISLDNERIENRRALEETKLSQKNSEKQSENANARWSKKDKKPNKINSNVDAVAIPPLCQPEPEPKPDNTTLPDAGAMCAALGITDETKSIGLLSLSDPIHWISSGCDMEMDILPTLRQIGARGKVVTSWAYCSRAVFEARDKRLAPSPQVTAPISRPAFSKSKSVASLAIENAMRSSNG